MSITLGPGVLSFEVEEVPEVIYVGATIKVELTLMDNQGGRLVRRPLTDYGSLAVEVTRPDGTKLAGAEFVPTDLGAAEGYWAGTLTQAGDWTVQLIADGSPATEATFTVRRKP